MTGHDAPSNARTGVSAISLLHPEPAPTRRIDRAGDELAGRWRLKQRTAVAALSILGRLLIAGRLLGHVSRGSRLCAERRGNQHGGAERYIAKHSAARQVST